MRPGPFIALGRVMPAGVLVVLHVGLPVRGADHPGGRLDVATGSASAFGTTGMNVNGTVQPHGRYTTYHFEYGPTDQYGARTPATPLPPRLAAHYHESWDENNGGLMSWLKSQHFRDGGAAGGFMRCTEPSRNDPNHVDGIGTVHLLKYAYPGPLPIAQSLYLGGGDPDFRGAKLSLNVRGVNFTANGAEVSTLAGTGSDRRVAL
jgi:hypothetical protein